MRNCMGGLLCCVGPDQRTEGRAGWKGWLTNSRVREAGIDNERGNVLKLVESLGRRMRGFSRVEGFRPGRPATRHRCATRPLGGPPLRSREAKARVVYSR